VRRLSRASTVPKDILSQAGSEVAVFSAGQVVKRGYADAKMLFIGVWRGFAAFFDRSHEAIAEARKGFNVCRLLGIVAEGEANLPDTKVQPIFKIDKRVPRSRDESARA
jgi:hypothetical protein